MLELKTKQMLSKDSHSMAKGFGMVRYRNTTYIPIDYETQVWALPDDPLRTMWVPVSRDQLRRLAAAQYGTLFANDGELSSFDFMVAQNATLVEEQASELLVKTRGGLKRLATDGTLRQPTGVFVPNTLTPVLNEDPAAKEKILRTVAEWLDSEEEANSLLHHLATALAPSWSAVKYVLLLGEGRNGKSVLMKMLQRLLSSENVSHVTRQHISEQSPVVTELNGKLMNIVFDGQASYLKDSGTEKSLIAGEEVPIRKLYESTPTMVQTTALFIEGLNREPKSNDKSSALQKRLVRFQFPNVYPLDHTFERMMLSEEMLGAFLAVLIDHYVRQDEVAVKLAPTTKALELQLEHMYVNSIGLQYLKYLEDEDPDGVKSLLGESIEVLIQGFQAWRVLENDLGTWAEPDVQALFHPLVHTERRSMRVKGQPRKVRVVTSLKQEAKAFVESLKENEHHEDSEALVAD